MPRNLGNVELFEVKIDVIKNSIFDSATYLLTYASLEDMYVIDCGDIEPIINYIEQNQLKLKGLFLTHSHFDHIYGMNDLVQKYSDCKIYTSQHGAEGLKNPKLNMSRYHDDVEDFIYQFNNIEILTDGQELQIGDGTMKVLETPGHDWSCLSFHLDKYLFTGDSYIPDTKPQYMFPKGNKKQYYDSELRILEYVKKNHLIIKPGHIV